MNAGGKEDTVSSRILTAAASLGMLGGGPAAAHRLLAALCNPDLSQKDLSYLVLADPGIAVRILKVANSTFYGHARAVETVDRAITLLGLDAVRGIAAAACLDRAVSAGTDTELLDSTAFVRHSVTAALSAEHLARASHPELAAEAFIGGLLHDLGAMIQASIEPEGVKQMLASLHANPMQDQRALESRYVAISQEHCAAVLFEHWQLPPGLVESARHHHAPLGAPEQHRTIAALVALGNHVSLMEGQTFGLEAAAAPLDVAVLSQAGVREEDLDRVARELPGRIAAFVLPLA